MACCTSRLVLVLSAAVLLVVLGAEAAVGSAPSYCVPGKAIPYSPLSGCVWYVASRSCDVVVAMLPVLKATCCGQLQDIPAECRCRALRVMMETDPLVLGAEPGAQQRCRAAQARFAPAVVTEAECRLRTVHGRPFCNALDAE
ncbi:unnamed protein product [Miscanthus lutarioriparius]|uniref:Bifunctional inhibitor/plant lipid transfer protein/seed storage helical domain-containing protein n=1 Tax=Miscanthus lutarioriparius TaxID=422564 RepID=A0A811SHR0_9POAL|nr:unnamed protein product [Miscanthus lutarioriparius]